MAMLNGICVGYKLVSVSVICLLLLSLLSLLSLNRYAAVTGANTSDVSMETYLQLGSNSIVRLHSILLASRLNRMTIDHHPTDTDTAAADDDDDDDDDELRPLIRSSLLSALSALPLRDVVC